MNDSISLAFDAGKGRAVLTFPNGRTLTVDGVNEEKANEFLRKHAAEFQKRDCCLSTVDGSFTRESGND